MLDELKVLCVSEGCGEVMQRGMLLSHSRGCAKGMVKCDDADCGLSVGLRRSVGIGDDQGEMYKWADGRWSDRDCRIIERTSAFSDGWNVRGVM